MTELEKEIINLKWVYNYKYEVLMRNMPRGWLKAAGTEAGFTVKQPGVSFRRYIKEQREHLRVMQVLAKYIKEYIPLPYDAGHK